MRSARFNRFERGSRLIAALWMLAASVLAAGGEAALAQEDGASATQPATAPSTSPQSMPANGAAGSGFLAASDGEHVWYVESIASGGGQPRYAVMHHGPGMAAGFAAQAFSVPTRPEGLLATEGRVFVFFVARSGGGPPTTPQREVVVARVERFSAASGLWSYEPEPSAAPLPALPDSGRLAGIVAHERNPMVLTVAGLEGRDARASGGDNGASAGGRLALWRFRVNAWESLPLPADIAVGPVSGPARLHPGRRPLLIVGEAARDGAVPQASLLYEWLDDERWSDARPIRLDASKIEGAASCDGQTYVALRGTPDDARTLRLLLVRPQDVYTVATIPNPPATYRLLGFRGYLAMAEQRAVSSGLHLTLYDPNLGQAREELTLGHRFAPGVREYQPLVLAGAMLVASIVMFLFRPTDPTKLRVTLPAGSSIAEPRRRFAALLIDMVPAGLFAGIVLDVPFREVFNVAHMPLLAGSWGQAQPVCLMLAFTIAHEAASEAIWGTTLGKWMMECRVANLNGGRASLGAIAVRNAMKIVEVAVPVLFVFVYINPYRQRLGDMAARTVVTTLHPPKPPDDGRARKRETSRADDK